MRPTRRRAILLAGLAILSLAPGLAASDGSFLWLSRDAAAGTLVLIWDGPGPQFDVYRSLDPASFPPGPLNSPPIDGLTWTDDLPPITPLVAYRVESICETQGTEICNRRDDDCDGEVDEDFDLDNDPANCGECGHVCTGQNATMGCENGGCVIVECAPGWGDANRDPTDGCEYVCEPAGTDRPDDEFLDTDCDGVDGYAAEAVFVAVSGDDADPGTRALPMRTLAAALDRAAAEGKDVYASQGVYREQVALRAGVGLYGGYDRSDAWARAADHLTLIDGGERCVVGDAADGAVLDHFTLRASSSVTPGGSSYGIFLTSSTDVELSNLWIEADDGAPGAGGDAGAIGASGGAGGPGRPGCEDSTFLCNTCARPAAGPGGSSSCGRPGGSGGRPGHGNGDGDWGVAGSGGAAGGGPGAGGGAGCGSSGDGGRGGDGASGARGGDGPGGGGLGQLAASGYLPAAGGEGSAGTHGHGGGGGGGGGGGTDTCDSWGSSGGGGGAGGCAGGSGIGGGGGGGSFAVYLHDSAVRLRRSTLIARNGGRGGSGGPGGAGGLGGPGGEGGPYGGDGDQDDASCGGSGGDGGGGGPGGHGGGGGGGPSIALVRAGAATADLGSGVVFLTGLPGAGGSSPANDGAQGLALETYP